MYNLTNLTNAASISGVFTSANDFTGGILFGLFVLAVFFIMLMALKRWDFDDALLSSSFVCFLISAILAAAQLLNLLWALGFLAIAAFTAFFMYVSK